MHPGREVLPGLLDEPSLHGGRAATLRYEKPVAMEADVWAVRGSDKVGYAQVGDHKRFTVWKGRGGRKKWDLFFQPRPFPFVETVDLFGSQEPGGPYDGAAVFYLNGDGAAAPSASNDAVRDIHRQVRYDI